MNETNLIARLQQNIKIGTNSCVNVNKAKKQLEALHKEGMPSYIANEKLGPNSNIHMPSEDELAKDIKNAMAKAKQNYEMVNHPKHYNNYDVEVVDMMEKIWGTKATMEWCKMTAYKYRMRMGTKPGENDSPEAMKAKLLEDFNKEQWYLKKADELKSKLLDKSIDMNQ